MSETRILSTDTQSLSAQLDRIPRLGPLHRKLIGVLVALFIFDIVDLFAFGYTASAIRAEWNLSIEQLGLLGSTVFVGMVLGGLVGGRLADRFGRRAIILIAVTVFSLASIGSAVSLEPVFFAVTRVITGFGLTAATGAILVMVSELFPRQRRGRVMAVVSGLALLGGPLVALTSLVLVPAGAWRWVYVFGGFGVLVVLLAMRILPESPRWLASRGRISEAEAAVVRFQNDYVTNFNQPLPPVADFPATPPATKTSYFELVRPKILPRTLVAVVVFSINVLLTGTFGQWLPVMLIERGYPESQALTFSLILSLGVVAGALLSYPVIDRFERKFVIGVCAATAAIGYLLIGLIDAVPLLIVAGLVTTAFASAAATAIFAYVPEIFPVAIRGTGAGVANGFGRFVGMFGSVIVAAILVATSTVGVFVYLACLAVILALVVLLGPRIRMRRTTDPDGVSIM